MTSTPGITVARGARTGTARGGKPGAADQVVRTMHRQVERVSCVPQCPFACAVYNVSETIAETRYEGRTMLLPTQAVCQGSTGTRATQRCRLPRGVETWAERQIPAQAA